MSFVKWEVAFFLLSRTSSVRKPLVAICLCCGEFPIYILTLGVALVASSISARRNHGCCWEYSLSRSSSGYVSGRATALCPQSGPQVFHQGGSFYHMAREVSAISSTSRHF